MLSLEDYDEHKRPQRSGSPTRSLRRHRWLTLFTQLQQKSHKDTMAAQGLKYSDADWVEEWCDLTKVEVRRHGPAIAARLWGLIVTVLKIWRLLWNITWQPWNRSLRRTTRPSSSTDSSEMHERTDGLSEMADQVWDCKEQMIGAWLDVTMPSPTVDHADVVAEVDRLRQAERERQQAEVCQTFAGPQADLQAAINSVAMPDGTDAMREAPRETVWRRRRRARAGLSPITDKHAALMALVMADLSRERPSWTSFSSEASTWNNPESLSSLCSMLRSHHLRTQAALTDPSRGHSLLFCMDSWVSTRVIGCLRGMQEIKDSPTFARTSSGNMTRSNASGWGSPSKAVPWRKAKVRARVRREREKGKDTRRFFRSYRKGAGKGKKSQEGESASGKAHLAEEDQEEAEEETLLTEKKKKEKKKKKWKKGLSLRRRASYR